MANSVSVPAPSCGLETRPVRPTASAYFKYVSMDATTTRASTVIRSIPTREILTQASITIPLSRTRSSTSIRLEPPDTRSTAIEGLLHHKLTFGAYEQRFAPSASSPALPVLAPAATFAGQAGPRRPSDWRQTSTSSNLWLLPYRRYRRAGEF